MDPGRFRQATRLPSALRKRAPHRPSRLQNPLVTDAPAARFRRRAWLTVGALIALGLALWAGQQAAPYFLELVRGTRGLGAEAPVAFILAYAVAVAALIPASILTIAAGAVFGVARGVLYSLVGATLGSSAAFLLGRHGARRFVARWLASMPRYLAIEQAVMAQGARIVFLLRLSPVMPFNVLNYALGLTTLSLADFVLASSGMLPGTVVYAYFGKMTGEALVLAGQTQVPHDSSYYALLLAGFVVTIAVTAVVARTARRALRGV
jgi:uncharacterized membrane protein YdjX (TVP38/TMEM64 family)